MPFFPVADILNLPIMHLTAKRSIETLFHNQYSLQDSQQARNQDSPKGNTGMSFFMPQQLYYL